MKELSGYRLLRVDELQEMEKEFILFLSANGIEGTQWEKIKFENPDKVQKLIAQFSHMVWERIFDGKAYMEWADQHYDYVGEFQEDKINMIRLSRSAPVQIAKKTITTATTRKQAMFEAMEAGAQFCDRERFKVCFNLWSGNSEIV